jgi:hypothetical protein
MGNKLTEYTEKVTGNYQNGFRKSWGIIDNTYIETSYAKCK